MLSPVSLFMMLPLAQCKAELVRSIMVEREALSALWVAAIDRQRFFSPFLPSDPILAGDSFIWISALPSAPRPPAHRRG